jgi:hypothetical protein
MPVERLEEADAYTVKWDTELDVPIFKWNGFTEGEEFRENARQWEEIMVERGVGVYGGSAIASMEMEKVEESLSAIHPDYEFRIFPTEAEAKSWQPGQ